MSKKHTVKRGESIEYISNLYVIPVELLLEFNEWIPENKILYEGEILIIPSISVVLDRTLKEVSDKVSSVEKESDYKIPSNQIIPDSTITVNWGGLTFTRNQLGIATATKNTNIYTRVSGNKYVKGRTITKGSSYKVYGDTSENGGMFNVGKEEYLLKQESFFTALPEDKVKELRDKSSAGSVIDTTVATVTNVSGQKNSTSPDYKTTRPQELPQLMMPGYRRSRLQIKKEDGSLINIELRVTGFVRSRNNQYSPSQTNAGWSVHVGGPGLSVLNVNCTFLDTKTNRESSDFDKIYKKEIEPKSSSGYFKSPIISFLHKNVEYKGLITTDSLTDEVSSPLSQNFTFSFLVLSEKSLVSTSEQAKKFTIDRQGKDEITFLSDLSNLLINPITGK